MEVIITLVRLVYHDAASIRLKLEIADAVKFYVSHHVWKHPLDEDGAYFACVVFLAAQSLGYVPFFFSLFIFQDSIAGKDMKNSGRKRRYHPNCSSDSSIRPMFP